MLIAYWLLAGLMAVFYLYSGGVKMVRSKEALRPMMGWVDDLPLAAVRVIGLVEVLGAIGLVLPPLVGILPALALAAAMGFVVLQIVAAAVHLRRHDAPWMNLVLIALAGVVAWLATVWL